MLFFWFLIIATSVRTQASKPVLAHQTTFRVHGSVTDARMTGLKGAELEFTGGVKRIVERTAGNGTFSVSLEPGNYTLSATAKGYCRSTQDLEVTANESDISLNIALLNCSDCPEMSIDFVQPVIEANAAPSTPSFPNGLVFKYQQEVLGDEQSAGLGLSIWFGRRTDLGEFVEFTGLDCPGQGKLAVLQYRGGSLEAVKLRLAKKDLKLKAEGEVIVADRQGIRRGSIAEIDLHPEAPIAVILK